MHLGTALYLLSLLTNDVFISCREMQPARGFKRLEHIETRQAVDHDVNFVGMKRIRTTDASDPVNLDGSKFLTSEHLHIQSNIEVHMSGRW
jgi:hypothetical protein